MRKFTLLVLSLLASAYVFAGDPIPPTFEPIPIEPEFPRPTPTPLSLINDIEAYYSAGAVTIEFNVDLGDADIMVTNLHTGESWWDSVSGVGATTILLSEDEGSYEIQINTDYGEYTGSFKL